MPTVINGTSAVTGIHYRDETVSTINSAVDVTYTAAQCLGGIISRDAGLVAKSDTLPPAASLIAAMQADNSEVTVGSTFDFIVDNVSGLAVITLNAGTGGTISGDVVVGVTKAKRVHVLVTNVTVSFESVTFYENG